MEILQVFGQPELELHCKCQVQLDLMVCLHSLKKIPFSHIWVGVHPCLVEQLPRTVLSSKSTCNSSSLSKFSQSSPPLSQWIPPFIPLDLSNTYFKNFFSPLAILELLVQIGEAYFLSNKPTAKSRKSKKSKPIEFVQMSRQTMVMMNMWNSHVTLVKTAPGRSNRISQFKSNTNL